MDKKQTLGKCRTAPWHLNVENREHLTGEAAQQGRETRYKQENLINKYGKDNETVFSLLEQEIRICQKQKLVYTLNLE